MAFWRLHGDRPSIVTGYSVAMGATVIEPRPSKIPFLAIDRYAERYGIVGEAFDMLLDLLGVLDTEYLAWDAEQAQTRAERRSTG
jgi:hypothetical protein